MDRSTRDGVIADHPISPDTARELDRGTQDRHRPDVPQLARDATLRDHAGDSTAPAFVLQTNKGPLGLGAATACVIRQTQRAPAEFDVHATWPARGATPFYAIDVTFMMFALAEGVAECSGPLAPCGVFVTGNSFKSELASTCAVWVKPVSPRELTIHLEACVVATDKGQSATLTGRLTCTR